ncbi:MAG: hypothetical protein ABIQ73_00240 [Acidimicrobiales bacterium]
MLNRLPHLLALLVAVVLLAGCSQNLGPKSYTAEVKDNYTKTCVEGSTQKLGAAAAATYCQCTIDGLSAPTGIHFDTFKSFETYLRDHVGDDVNNIDDLANTNKYDAILTIFQGCAPVGPTAAGASASTTVPTTTTAR